MPIKKLLIANRGEIACRIIKTAKKMSIKTLAIYSTIDKNSLHVKLADEAYCVGDAPARDSYLNSDKIIDIAKHNHCDAIHPGYGFLSENADFATRCQQQQLIFIGPSANAIRLMGDKCQAKQYMEKAGITTVPGYQGEQTDLSTLKQAAKKIGLPLLIKAAAGGGGKGMRLIQQFDEWDDALASAQREAQSSFGDQRIFLEKYIQPARHIEVQVFVDQTGHGVYLFDRDCSAQRRHQKIIEEAPAAHLTEKTRKKMGETAVKAAEAIDYLGAGTIEFLVDSEENFYFMEMNTRLQVEHPVTEMITGTDLVAWQLKIAMGDALPLQQAQLKINGHAIEARIYAENPQQNFSPASGTLSTCLLPKESEFLRIDSGVQTGDVISPYYDPLLAKLIVWQPTRAQAMTALKKALAQCAIVGVKNNISFLAQICNHKDFQQGNIDTQWVERHTWQTENTLNEEMRRIAAYLIDDHRQRQAAALAACSTDPYSPWFKRDHWRANQKHLRHIDFWFKDKHYQVAINHHDCHIQAHQPYHFHITIKEKTVALIAINTDNDLHVFIDAQHFIFSQQNPKQIQQQDAEEKSAFLAPMPGTVIEVSVSANQTVKQGERLMVLEAMKMEHSICAPSDGMIKKIHYQVGDLLDEGVELLEFQVTRE